jgi:hypothetical protein
MADLTDLVNLSTDEPEPTAREGADTDDFQKSEVVPSTSLKGGAAIPTHGEDGHPLSLDDKWALLWPSRSQA